MCSLQKAQQISMIVNNDNAYITLNSQDFLFIILQNLILGYAVTKIFIQSLNSFPLIKAHFNEAHALFRNSIYCSCISWWHNISQFISGKYDICEDNLLKMTFLILVLRTRKGHISSHGELLIIYSGGWTYSGPKLDMSVITPCRKKKHTICHVGFGLLICRINVQLPSPLLGSPLAQGVKQTSLAGRSNSYLSKNKRNMMAVQMNSFFYTSV